MSLFLLYRPNSEYARSAEEFVKGFNQVYPNAQIEILDADSVEGTTKATLYDIFEMPAILAVANDGQLLNSWTGPTMPLVDEVAGYITN